MDAGPRPPLPARRAAARRRDRPHLGHLPGPPRRPPGAGRGPALRAPDRTKKGPTMKQRTHADRRRPTLAAVALLAGCGGGGDQATSAPSSPAAARSRQQVGFTPGRGPEAAQAKVETDIAACMKTQGFEYTPVDPVAPAGRARSAGRTSATRTSRASSATASRRSTAAAAPRAIRTPGSAQQPRPRRTGAPTTRRCPAAGPSRRTSARPTRATSASSAAARSRRPSALLGGTQLLTTLQRKLDELDDAILQDQRMVRAFEAWRGCVRDTTGGDVRGLRGHRAGGPEAPRRR